MKDKYSIKRTVFTLTILHTAVIAMLAYMVFSGPVSAVWLAVFAVAFIASTIYTASVIVKSVQAKMQDRVEDLSKYASQLQTVSINLDLFEKELKQKAGTIEQRQREIEQRANKINEYQKQLKERAGALNEYNAKIKGLLAGL